MKHPNVLASVKRVWPQLALGMVAIVVVAANGFSVFGVRHSYVPESGLQAARQVSQQVATLPDIANTAVTAARTAAAQTCSQNGSGKLLLVSISKQHIWACNGAALANESAVTTGASALTNVDNATPTGTWHIYSKQTNRHLTGCDVNGCWNDPVAYWMPFDDQIGFHDSSWQTFPYGSDLYTTQGSHGCVHLPLDFITWVYTWAPVGTTVTVTS